MKPIIVNSAENVEETKQKEIYFKSMIFKDTPYQNIDPLSAPNPVDSMDYRTGRDYMNGVITQQGHGWLDGGFGSIVLRNTLSKEEASKLPMGELACATTLFDFDAFTEFSQAFRLSITKTASGFLLTSRYYGNFEVFSVEDIAFHKLTGNYRVMGEPRFLNGIMNVLSAYVAYTSGDDFNDREVTETDYPGKFCQLTINYANAGAVDSKGLTGAQIQADKSEPIEAKTMGRLIAEMYPDIKVELLVKQFMNSRSNFLLLHGDKGTGKTTLGKFMIKYLAKMSESSREWPIVTQIKDLNLLRDPSFYNLITKNNVNLVILDDVEASKLANEDDVDASAQNSSVVKQLNTQLNGVFENHVKFVLSTNSDVDCVSRTLLRRGRTFNVLEIRPMPYELALSVWTDIMENNEDAFYQEFGGPKERDVIYQSDLMDLHERVNAFHEESYLVDPSVSTIERLMADETEGKKANVGFIRP